MRTFETAYAPNECTRILRDELYKRQHTPSQPRGWIAPRDKHFRLSLREIDFWSLSAACEVSVRLQARREGGTLVHCRFFHGMLTPRTLMGLPLFILASGVLLEAVANAAVMLLIELVVVVSFFVSGYLWNRGKAALLEERLYDFLLETLKAEPQKEEQTT